MINVLHTLRQSFSPLRLPNLRLYLSGQAVSLLGTWMQVTAQGWVVWELTHSEAALGLVAMFSTLPILLLGLWAGVWADRRDRRKILIATQITAMLLAFVLALLVQTKAVQLWQVYVLSALLGIVTAIDFPTQQAFIGDLSGMTEVRKAVVVNAMIVQVGRMLGPALAGFVVGAFGAATAFWINGLSFLAVIFSLMRVRAHQTKYTGTSNPIHAARDGLRFIRSQPRIQDVILFTVLVTFFGLSIINIFPAVAAEVLHGDAATLGLLLASSGAGALVGSTIVAPLAQSLRRTGLIMGLAVMWAGLWFIGVSLTSSLVLAMMCTFIVALSVPTVITTANGLLQTMAPPDMRARLISAFIIVSFGIQPISSLVVGFTAEKFGTPMAIRINGVLMVIGAMLMLTFRVGLRQWEPKPIQAVQAHGSH